MFLYMKIDPKVKNELKIKLKDALANIKKRITVISSYKLNETDINELYEVFPQLRQAQVDYLVDEDLIAGFIIKIGSKVIDLSLKGRLQNLKNLFYEIA